MPEKTRGVKAIADMPLNWMVQLAPFYTGARRMKTGQSPPRVRRGPSAAPAQALEQRAEPLDAGDVHEGEIGGGAEADEDEQHPRLVPERHAARQVASAGPRQHKERDRKSVV